MWWLMTFGERIVAVRQAAKIQIQVARMNRFTTSAPPRSFAWRDTDGERESIHWA
mgnify:CR=1 FL=1